MNEQLLDTTVAQIVTDRPGTARVFERAGIDYCCGGRRPLAEAALEVGLDPIALAQQVEEAGETVDEGPDVAALSMTGLADHIEQTHHAYLRRELPRLAELLEKVVRAHGAAHPWVLEMRSTYGPFRAELESHMFKEEQILFPAIRSLEAGSGLGGAPCGSVAGPIAVMESEHDAAGAGLEQFRALSSGYQPPEDACPTFRALLGGLEELEQDMHRHIHKENHILFPRALEFERKAAAGGRTVE